MADCGAETEIVKDSHEPSFTRKQESSYKIMAVGASLKQTGQMWDHVSIKK
jgi:hypothetical protein